LFPQIRSAALKLLIFDIDGTLTHLAGATRRAFDDAFQILFGLSANIAGVKMHGRTDPMIFRDCYLQSGLNEDWRKAYRAFQPVYIEALPARIAASQGAHLHVGVLELLQELDSRRNDVALTLGSGNMEAGGRAKVGYFDLNKFFPVGGFGDLHECRAEIMREAIANAERHWQRSFARNDIWVIGDTAHDIEGGKAVQAKTMGVATGGEFSVQQLVAAQADAVFADFSDTRAVLKAFGLDKI
jgi:phosphoglycolate phosphatase